MKFLETLRALPLPRQLMLAGAVLGVVMAMTVLVRGAMEEPMALLYSGLSPERSGEIIDELDQRNIAYEISGESIFVPTGERDKVRFALAREGLPRPSVVGYELLDSVNGFSVTSEMYNASYWRAKEGELTRTILAVPGVASARVHIGATLRSGFSRSKPTQTASVTLTTTHSLSKNQAEAIQYLVALAVAGLNPADVAVIDPNVGILAGPNADDGLLPEADAQTQSAALESKITRLLEARLGPGNAQVSVSMDLSRQRQLTSSVQFDPDSRVIRQRSSNDVAESSTGGAGAMTVASNLPQEGEENGGGSSRTMKNSTENVAYEMNETRTETELLPGEVQRISIAVLLNETSLGIDPAAADAQQQIDTIAAEFEQLIRSAAGLDADRGDDLTVDLMPFQEVPVEDLMEPPGFVQTFLERNLMSVVQIGLLSLVVLALAFGVIKPALFPKPAKGDAEPAGEGSGSGGGDDSIAIDPLDYLKEYARERELETTALLQDWLTEDRKVAVNE